MNALSLFSGIGGLDLAAEMSGIKVKAFCEIEPFPVEVLKKRFPGVHIFNDVKTLTKESFMEVMLKNGGGVESSQPIDIIFGGFPCQDLSQAGKQVGLTGARSGLWFEMLRVISEFRPRYVVAENVRGAVNLALDTVYSGLVGEGYNVYPYVIPASAVGAPHQRERLFVVGVREDVANTYCERYLHRKSELNTAETGEYAQRDFATGSEFVENPGCELRQGGSECGEVEGKAREGATRDAQFSGGTLWPSPVASDGSCGGIISPDDTYVQKASGLFRKINRNGTDGSVGLARMVRLWPTPTQRDYKGTSAEEGLIRNDGKSRMDQLPNAVKFWPTAQARDWKGSSGRSLKGNEIDLPTAIKKASIKTSGQLNPDWVGQLMGYPEGWTDLDVDEPREWAGWPALLGENILWATPNCMDTLPSRSYEAMKKQALNGARKNRSRPGNLREQIDPEMCKAYEDASHENGGNVKAIEVHSQYPYEFPRTTTGCKNRAKQLKAYGNAVVPAQAYPFFKAIAEIEKITLGEVIP